MLYRETGDFKTSYRADAQSFPLKLDRAAYWALLLLAFGLVPFVITDYWANAILIPVLIWGIAALGLNILTGYCGQVSLGSGGFMAVGAYSVYKLMTGFPEISILLHILAAGGITAVVGVGFGLPSLRIKGFYLAVATLAAQFFLIWLFTGVEWFYNGSASGQISAPERTILGLAVTGPSAAPWAKYLLCLGVLFLLAWVARNLTRGMQGRQWRAIRDMDIAAEIIGVNPLWAKLTAFATSSFFIGVAGALYFAVYLGAAEAGAAFGLDVSFQLLFMIIIGGLGSIFGALAGAAFLVLLPLLLKAILVGGLGWDSALAAHLELMILGALILLVLVYEPKGLAALWAVAKEKLRVWPFPH